MECNGAHSNLPPGYEQWVKERTALMENDPNHANKAVIQQQIDQVNSWGSHDASANGHSGCPPGCDMNGSVSPKHTDSDHEDDKHKDDGNVSKPSFGQNKLLTSGPSADLKPGTSTEYDEFILEAAEKYDLDPNLIKAVITAESTFDPNARSDATPPALGLMQVKQATANGMDGGNPDLFDPKTNIDLGSRYLKQMIDQSDGDVELGLIKYNAGPQAGHNTTPDGQPHSAGHYVTRVMDVFNAL